MNLLPPTNSKCLTATVSIVCTAIISLYVLHLWYVRNVVCVAIATVLMPPTAIGLWRLKEAARRVVSAGIMFLVFTMPIGILNPFALSDMQLPYPDLWPIIVKVYLFVALGVLIVHILGKHKHEFTPLFKQKEDGAPSPP